MAVQWDIYTLAGRRLRTLREEYTEAGPRILEWDGRDAKGDEIANGTYLFVLRGSGASADGREITKTGKLVIMR
jgi:flagellar hook assembly protein FlgD